MASRRSNPAVRVPCSSCGGTGHVPLVPSLSETLDALRDGPRTAESLAHELNVWNTTAMNNRLEKLRALGLVSRVRVVRGYVYAARGGEKTDG